MSGAYQRVGSGLFEDSIGGLGALGTRLGGTLTDTLAATLKEIDLDGTLARKLAGAVGAGGLSGSRLKRFDSQLQSKDMADAIEKTVLKRLSVLDKGLVLRSLLIALPAIATVLSLAGGLYTVYASSSDCPGTRFRVLCRAFLYTAICYSVVSTAIRLFLDWQLVRLMKYPTVAFLAYCLQALVLAAFVATMSTLLVLVYRNACSAVRDKVISRLGL